MKENKNFYFFFLLISFGQCHHLFNVLITSHYNLYHNKKSTLSVFPLIHNLLYVYLMFPIRFDEVDDANPTKKPTIHEVLLAGKRKSQRLPFEHELQVPRGNLINILFMFVQFLNTFSFLFLFSTLENFCLLLFSLCFFRCLY